MIQLDAAGRSTAIRGAATEASMTASLTELDPASRSITLAINHFACPSPKGAIGYVASATRFLLLAFGSSQPSPRDDFRGELDRAKDHGMRRVDRMDLKDKIGHALECAVGTQRCNHVLRRSDMHVKRRDKLGKRSSWGTKPISTK